MYIEFVLLAFALLVSFFLSGSETALMTVSRMKVRLRAEQGDRAAEKLLVLLLKSDRMIITILIGNTIANVAMTVLVILIAENYRLEYCLVGYRIERSFIILFAEVLQKQLPQLFRKK